MPKSLRGRERYNTSPFLAFDVAIFNQCNSHHLAMIQLEFVCVVHFRGSKDWWFSGQYRMACMARHDGIPEWHIDQQPINPRLPVGIRLLTNDRKCRLFGDEGTILSKTAIDVLTRGEEMVQS